MNDFKISELMGFQHQLYEKNREYWDARIPQNAEKSILWTVDEMGEVIAILKKKGYDAVMDNEHVRQHYVEECCDVMMYWLDMMECMGITADEFCTEYKKKFERNMKRTWEENDTMYED